MDDRFVGLPQSGHPLAVASATPRLAAPLAETSPPLIRFTCESGGEWTVVTANHQRHGDFADIEDAVRFARQSCEAAPATLVLNVDGLVVVVQQDRGWTRPLIGARSSRP